MLPSTPTAGLAPLQAQFSHPHLNGLVRRTPRLRSALPSRISSCISRIKNTMSTGSLVWEMAKGGGARGQGMRRVDVRGEGGAALAS